MFFFTAGETPRYPNTIKALPSPLSLAKTMKKFYIGKLSPELPKNGFLFIHDEVPTIPRARTFDIQKHSFNPLSNIDYRKASDIVEIFDALFERGDSTLTKDTGLDFIAEALDAAPESLATLIAEPDKRDTPGHIWAWGKVRKLLRSPVLERVLNTPTNFSFNPRSIILARLNRAELGDFDCLALGLFLIGHFKGQIVLEDGGFYLRDTHASLIHENRLVAGVRFLDQLPEKLRMEVLMVENKTIGGATYDDAVLLAKNAGLIPDPARVDNDFNRFVERAIQPPKA